MKLQLYLFLSLYLLVASCSTKTEKNAQKEEATELSMSYQILDFYTKYSKGNYEAMQSNFADEVKLFLTATHINPQQVVNEIKAKADSGVYFIPDMTSLETEQQKARIKVIKKTLQGIEKPFWAHIEFDSLQQIVAYQEKTFAPTQNQPIAQPTNYRQYNGLYAVAGKEKFLNLHWLQGSEISYSIGLTSPDCMGEFTGKAFFIDQHTAVSGNGAHCKITFDFSTSGKVTITEIENCRNAQTQGCSFKGVYQVHTKKPNLQ